HHFAFVTLFEIAEAGGRSDLKSEMFKELDRYKSQFQSYRGNPSVSEDVLNAVLDEINTCYQGLNVQGSRISNCISDNEWLSALRNRASIPGGTCSFDLPAYHHWQHRTVSDRQKNIARWAEPIRSLHAVINLLLRLMRKGGSPQRVMTQNGQYQQNLPQGRFQLMRVFMDPSAGLIPEISGNRMMAWVRLMRLDYDGNLQHVKEDTSFEMELCG
ncbi:MAG: cell division protein ZapD, partial [Betaproteobacteria bacterium]|nr:cell division protein ZapD [Betaproteobacteria bacterium]